jgi:hypothetical protein
MGMAEETRFAFSVVTVEGGDGVMTTVTYDGEPIVSLSALPGQLLDDLLIELHASGPMNLVQAKIVQEALSILIPAAEGARADLNRQDSSVG